MDVCSHVKLEDPSVLQERDDNLLILESEREQAHF